MAVQPNAEITALTRVSPQTWAYIIILIFTLAGWGWATLANTSEIKDQKIDIEKKADKETVNHQYEALMQRLDDLQKDIREVRRYQRERDGRE